MLKIQVLGKGMIPRGYGLAPRKEFFKADLNLIQTILMTPGLKVNMLAPDNKVIPVTRETVKKLWDKYRSDRIQPVVKVEEPEKAEENKEAPVSPTSVTPAMITPEAPKNEEKDTQAVNTTKVDDPKPVQTNEVKLNIAPVKPVEETKDEVKEEVKVEEKKEETHAAPTTGGIKPITNPNENKNNNQKNHK